MTTDRRTLLLAAPAMLLPSLAAAQSNLSPADRALVEKASAWLQGLTRAKGRFVQTSPRGVVTRGEVYIHRPGKVRFAYDPPSNLLVVADGYNVSVYDQRLKTFDRYPLGSTPLSLFLSKTIRFDQGVSITAVRRLADGFSIVARDSRRQAEGQVTLTFSNDPMGLREWVLTDAQGGNTRVALQGMQAVASLDPKLFVLRDPRPRSGRT